MSPLAWPFLDSKDQMDDQNTQGNSLGGSTIDTLWTGLGLRSTTHIPFPYLDSKQLVETKIFGQFVDARQKFWPGVASVEL